MKNKDEVFIKFKEFKALIKNHTKKKIKIFLLYNGREFTSNEFKELCKDSGIKRELTTPYNPQQNGVAERKNRTICEAAKAMLSDLDLPLSLGLKLHVLLCTFKKKPSCHLGGKTPEEVFIDKKPAVDHMRIFGTPVYIHVPKKRGLS